MKNNDINGDNMSEFQPPVTEYDITSFHENEQGGADVVSVLVVDALKKAFTMRIVTQTVAEREVIEEDLVGEEREPEFVFPQDSISVEDVDAIVAIPPALLSIYLVPQAED